MIDVKKEVYTIGLDDFDKELLMVYAPLHRYVGVVSKKSWVENKEALINDIMDMPIHESIQAYMDGVPQDVYASRLRLNLTQNCNLRCTYCAVDEGINSKDITTEMINASLQLLSSDYKKNNAKQMQITFSGGEPTTRPHLLRYAIDSAKQIAEENETDVKFHLLTNGIFGKEMASYIANNFHKVQVSYDGESNVIQRPTITGENSCSIVHQSITRLHELNVPISVRITASRNNFDNIISTIDEIKAISDDIDIDIGIVASDGRARDTSDNFDILPPDFVDLYTQIISKYEDKIGFGGVEIHSLGTYVCGISRPGMVACPNGKISACTRIIDDRHPLAESIFYGEYKDKNYSFSEEKMDALRKIDFFSIKDCQNCFCKWHCMGGCPVDKPSFTSRLNDDKCFIIKEITKLKLIKSLFYDQTDKIE